MRFIISRSDRTCRKPRLSSDLKYNLSSCSVIIITAIGQRKSEKDQYNDFGINFINNIKTLLQKERQSTSWMDNFNLRIVVEIWTGARALADPQNKTGH